MDSRDTRVSRLGTPLALGALVLLLTALIGTGIGMELYGQNAFDRLNKAHKLLDVQRLIYGYLVDMQTSERGYAISANEEFLQPYWAAREKLPPLWSELDSLAGESDRSFGITDRETSLTVAATRLYTEADTWLRDVAAPSIALVRDGRQAEAFAAVASGQSSTAFNKVRDASNELTGKTGARLATAITDLNQARQIELGLLALLGILAAGSAAVAITVSRHESGQQEAARLRAEAERRRLLTIIENQPIGILLVRQPDGAILLQNSAAASIVSKDEWNSIPIEEHISRFTLTKPDGTPLEQDELPVLRALRKGVEVTDYEVRFQPPGGLARDLLVSAAPLLDERGRVTSAVVVLQDVTQMRRLDQRKDEFIATAAHEIRNPLAALSGYQQLLQRIVNRTDAPDTIIHTVEAIGKQTSRLNTLVERLLDAQRIQLGRLVLDKAPLNLCSLIEGAVSDARSASGDTHEISVDLPSTDIVGTYDGTRLEQVMGNLIGNAVRYSPDGSRIDVRLIQSSGEARVEIEDQGPGVSPDKRAHLFSRYYQSDDVTTGNLAQNSGFSIHSGNLRAAHNVSKRRGLGLGLFISSEIIRAHNGSIGVEPNPAGGSIFWFTLPLNST